MVLKTKIALLALLVVSSSCVKGDVDENDKEEITEEKAIGKEKFFVASYYTTTFIALSTTTSQVPYYCVQAFDTKPCTGRRLLRRKRRLNIDNASEVNPVSSLDEVTSSNDSPDDKGDSKFFFTVWRTATSTATVVSTKTNSAITISLSAWCTYNSFTTLPLCG